MPKVDALTEPDIVGTMDSPQWSVHVAPASMYVSPANMLTGLSPLMVIEGGGLSSSMMSTVSEALSSANTTPPVTPLEVGRLSPVPSDMVMVLSSVSLFGRATSVNIAVWPPSVNLTFD